MRNTPIIVGAMDRFGDRDRAPYINSNPWRRGNTIDEAGEPVENRFRDLLIESIEIAPIGADKTEDG